jgi:GNAT superfamily N-acetyltransferase
MTVDKRNYFRALVSLYESSRSSLAKMYHLSEKDLGGKTLTPKVPKNFMTERGYEDSEIKRVSFAETIGGALLGMSQDLKGRELFVHEPEDYDIRTIPNREIVENNYVPDASLSGELWALEDVKLRRVGKIRVLKAKPNPKTYTYGDGIRAETYEWDYEWMQKPEFVQLTENDGDMDKIVKAAGEEWGDASDYFRKLSSKRIAFKLVDGDELLGFFSIVFDDDTTGSNKIAPWLEKMYTFPKHRSEGFGKMMQEKAEEVSKARGYGKMLLWTDLDGYYEKTGWKHETNWKGKKGVELKLYSKKI